MLVLLSIAENILEQLLTRDQIMEVVVHKEGGTMYNLENYNRLEWTNSLEINPVVWGLAYSQTEKYDCSEVFHDTLKTQ